MTKDELIAAVIAQTALSKYTPATCDEMIKQFWTAVPDGKGLNADAMVAAAIIMAQLAFDAKDRLAIAGVCAIALEALENLKAADSASSELARIARGRAN